MKEHPARRFGSHKVSFTNSVPIPGGGMCPFDIVTQDPALKKYLPVDRLYIHNYTANALQIWKNQNRKDSVPIAGFMDVTIKDDGMSSFTVVNQGLAEVPADTLVMIVWKEPAALAVSSGGIS